MKRIDTIVKRTNPVLLHINTIAVILILALMSMWACQTVPDGLTPDAVDSKVTEVASVGLEAIKLAEEAVGTARSTLESQTSDIGAYGPLTDKGKKAQAAADKTSKVLDKAEVHLAVVRVLADLIVDSKGTPESGVTEQTIVRTTGAVGAILGPVWGPVLSGVGVLAAGAFGMWRKRQEAKAHAKTKASAFRVIRAIQNEKNFSDGKLDFTSNDVALRLDVDMGYEGKKLVDEAQAE